MSPKSRSFHSDTALAYRGVRVYHTFRDLAGGRENATALECWLTWRFSGRDADEGGDGQFDLRDLPAAKEDYTPAKVAADYVSPLLQQPYIRDLMAKIDEELCKPRAARAWVTSDPAAERAAILDDLNAWRQIEDLKWGESFDYQAIRKALKPRLRRRLEQFRLRAVSLLDRQARRIKNLQAGSDDAFNDILNHVVGLGRAEYLRALEDPKAVLEAHHAASYGTRAGYAESFAYCFQNGKP